jgi:hypothetical protein
MRRLRPGSGPFNNLQPTSERMFAGFSYAIFAVIHVTFVRLIAPATAIDALGRARLRGPLAHLLVTDLSPTEIVFGPRQPGSFPA